MLLCGTHSPATLSFKLDLAGLDHLMNHHQPDTDWVLMVLARYLSSIDTITASQVFMQHYRNEFILKYFNSPVGFGLAFAL